MRGLAMRSRGATAAALAAALWLVAAPAPARAQRQAEDESAALVEQGRAALRDRAYADAAEALDAAIAVNPRRIDAYVLRATIHALRKEHAQGIALLRKAQALAPDNLDVLAALGGMLVAAGGAGQAAEGATMLEQVVAKEPGRYAAQSQLGRHHAAVGRWSDAVVALEAYLAARPASLAADDVVHHVHLAEAYLRTRRAAAARDLYDRVLAVRPREPAARMGRAWALAAIDCREALPALARLADLVEAHPEVLLVEGQCALSTGDAARALALGERYVTASRRPAATGWALVGEAAAATGDLERARAALDEARALEPARRRWGIKLAAVLRRAGDAAGGLAELERMGAPTSAADDPAWWRELGEALIAAGTPGDAAARLAPGIAALPDDAALRAIAGEAALRAGDVDDAIAQLEAAERAGHTARSRAWLAYALERKAAAAIAADDLGAAEALLTRAERATITPSIARTLAALRIELGRAADAIGVLERATELDAAAETWLLLGRARVELGQPGPARTALVTASKRAAGTGLAVDVAIERAALELAQGETTAAIDALGAVEPDARRLDARGADAALAAAYRDAQLQAHHAAGVAALRAGAAGRAVDLLERADALAGGDPAIRCDLAIATVATGDRDAARKRLTAVAKASCPFPAPADTQAVPILLAFIDGLDARRAPKALKALAKLEAKATGATRRLVAVATRVVALRGAELAYRNGELAAARKLLDAARRADTRAGADEVALNKAVLDLADGKTDGVVAALERLAPTLPEALVSLGVVAHQRGDGAEALARWRAAKQAGVRFAPLDEWIAAKERIWGGAP